MDKNGEALGGVNDTTGEKNTNPWESIRERGFKTLDAYDTGGTGPSLVEQDVPAMPEAKRARAERLAELHRQRAEILGVSPDVSEEELDKIEAEWQEGYERRKAEREAAEMAKQAAAEERAKKQLEEDAHDPRSIHASAVEMVDAAIGQSMPEEANETTVGGLTDEDIAKIVAESKATEVAPTGDAVGITSVEAASGNIIPFDQEKRKAISSKGFRRALLGIALGAATFVAACGNHVQKSDEAANQQQDSQRMEQQMQAETKAESVLTRESLNGMIDGSFNQDGNLGCYESEGKVGQEYGDNTAVGNPKLILEAMGIDPAKATPEDWGVAGEFIAKSMKYPAAFQARAYGLLGLGGLSQHDAENRIASMNDKEKAELMSELNRLDQHSTYAIIHGDGRVFRNHGIHEMGDGRHSQFIETALGSDVEILQKTTTFDDGGKVITFMKLDCANMLSVVLVVDENGKTTIVDVPDSDTPPSETPDAPVPTPEPTPPEPEPKPDPTPGHTPKDKEKERENAGDYVRPMEADPEEITTEQELEETKKENIESVLEQERLDNEKKEKDKQTELEQRAKENEAAQIAEERRQEIEDNYNNMTPEEQAEEDQARAAADEALENATNDAAEEQAIANEVTNEVVAEAQEGQELQEQANAAAETQEIPGEQEAENGTLNGSDFANIAQNFGQ